MNKSELKSKVREMLAGGRKRSEVFDELQGQGVKDSHLATFIAIYPDPERVEKYRWHVWGLIAIVLVQTLLGFVLINGMAQLDYRFAEFAPFGYVLVAAFSALFIGGFYVNRAPTYTAFIVLGIVGMANSFRVSSMSGGFPMNEGTSMDGLSVIGTFIGVAILLYAAYVMRKIFPDFGLFGPRKVAGQFAFTESGEEQAIT